MYFNLVEPPYLLFHIVPNLKLKLHSQAEMAKVVDVWMYKKFYGKVLLINSPLLTLAQKLLTSLTGP